MKVKLTCPFCGSEDIVKDATAKWDFEKQEMVLNNVYEVRWDCGDCGAEFDRANEEGVDE